MDIWPNSDGRTGNAAALMALTLGVESIVRLGEKYLGDRDGKPQDSFAVAVGVRAAAVEAAVVGNLLAVLADPPMGLS